jgi:hypothetical protein
MPKINTLGIQTSFGVPSEYVTRINDKCVEVKYPVDGTNAKLCANGNELQISGKYQDFVIDKLKYSHLNSKDDYFFKTLKQVGGRRRKATRKNRKASRKNRKTNRRR